MNIWREEHWPLSAQAVVNRGKHATKPDPAYAQKDSVPSERTLQLMKAQLSGA